MISEMLSNPQLTLAIINLECNFDSKVQNIAIKFVFKYYDQKYLKIYLKIYLAASWIKAKSPSVLFLTNANPTSAENIGPVSLITKSDKIIEDINNI